MESMDQKELKKPTRRSKKVKNLEEEVEFIFSQDESDEEVKENVEEILPKTPSRRDRRKNETTTPKAAPQAVLQEILQTPRRSCRKSIRPAQEYDDIVNKSLRSCKRSAKKHLLVNEEEDVEENAENQEDEIVQPKWTPAKVGRVSQKRNRKSKRNGKGKKKGAIETEEQDDAEAVSKTQKQEIKDQEEEQTKCEKDPEKVNVSEIVLEEDAVEENEQVLTNTERKEEITVEQMKDQEEEGTKLEKESEEVKDSKFVSVVDSKEEVLTNKASEEKIHAEKTEEKDKNVESMKIENESEPKELNKDIEEQISEEMDNDTDLMVTMTDEAQITPKDNEDKQEDNNEIDNALENREESIQLLQEDSEDCKEFEEKTHDEDICIVYEKNISNNDIKDEMEDKENDSFGSYLKSKKINISDLGLNLLKDEEDEKEIEIMDIEDEEIKPAEDVEDMPSLIVCDDDDDDDNDGAEDCKPSIKLNETFEAVDVTETDRSKNVVDINKITEKEVEKPNEEIMETLQMSDDDDGETPRKPPRVLKATPLKKQIVLLKDSVVKVNPKDIVLRGIRKRSLSVCINGNEQSVQPLMAGPLAKAKQDRMISFYSPANQHTTIEDLDRMIAKSLKKQKMQDNKNISNTFVTTRRKRSISLDESTMSTSHLSKLPRPVANQNFTNKTQTSTSTSKPLSRTKLPNFAAIHEKQFKKMENLVDHVSRKQERSKNLINSATKLRPVSAQKNISFIKNSNNIANEKPKALKKIDLGATSHINKAQLNNTITADLNTTQEVMSVSKVVNLPDPRLANNTKPIKNGTISRRLPQQQPIRNYLKPSQTTNIEKTKAITKVGPTKSTFNLSTSLMMKPTTSSSSFAEKAKVGSTKPTFNLSTSLMMKPTTSSTSIAEKANASYMSNEDKMASRLQRHMDLFKGRIPSTRAGVASRRNETILKGVRSNRRFELQMQHRKNLEQ